jgi:hypothetical protein
MNIGKIRPFLMVVMALILLGASQKVALAGPPLLCFPFDIGSEKSLPWEGGKWKAVRADYDINRLVDDTLALLNNEKPVIARMETLRRATIYAMNNGDIAAQLYSRLMDRTRTAKGAALPLALFDAGYLVETYKQAGHINQSIGFAEDVDGYALIVKAIEMQKGNPEMEFAAALISYYPKRNRHNEHVQKASAGATNNTLLARNIASHFNLVGK